MPSIERRWRLLLLAAALIALILPLGLFGPWLLFFVQGAPQSSPLSSLDLSTFFTLISLLGGAIWLWRLGWRGRAHEQARQRALAGDTLAIPPADIPLDTDEEAPATHLPLVVSWHLAHTSSVAYTITADDQGVTWRRPGKPDLLMPWDQARLLEVWNGGTGSGGRYFWRGYTLYSPTARVEWQEYPASYTQAVPDGIARDELAQRQRALLALIHARTGLTPRTFDAAFQLKDPSIPPRRFSLSGTAFALAIAAAFLFAAVAALVLPLTHYPLLNLYVAVTIAPIGLTILFSFFQTLVSSPDTPTSRAPRLAPSLPPTPPIALGDPEHAVALSHALSLRSRLSALFGVLLGAADLVAAALGGIVENASPSHASVFSIAGLRLFVAAVVSLPAIIVLMLAWGDVFKRATILQADATGLSERTGNKATMITWHEIAAVTARVKHGAYTTFAVTTHDSDTSIGWPAGASHARRNPSGLTITGAELAALVVAHSGRTLTIAADA